MSVDNAILLTLITCLFTSNIESTFAEECSVTKPACSCNMHNGKGYDLSDLSKEFIKSTPEFNRTFYFLPCQDKPLLNITGNNSAACSSASGVSLCLYQNEIGFSNLGLVANSKMTVDSADSNKLEVVFDNTTNGVRTKVSIKLVCNSFDKPESSLVEYLDKSNGYNYSLMLVSRKACKVDLSSSSLSTGSVLVIILFVFSGLYFGGGALALKLLRGATGWEMLPNQKFWFDLPALVRDGIAFTFNGCKVVSYDQI